MHGGDEHSVALAEARVINAVRSTRMVEVAEDLRHARLVFASGPIEAHVQFTTYCNMSCVMCWDGANPPVADIDPAVLDAVAQIPNLQFLVPHDGSEPTARHWNSVHQFARDHGFRLLLTTNVQTLSPQRFLDAADVIEEITLSIDSHDPDLLEAIRPGARAELILQHSREVAQVAAVEGISCSANIVLLAQNLKTVHETVAWLAGIGIRMITVVPMVNINGRSAAYDPVRQHGADQVEAARRRTSATARACGVTVWWGHTQQPLPTDPELDPSGLYETVVSDYTTLAHQTPGFCHFAHSGLRIDVDGETTPCGYAAQGELPLGNVRDQPFDAVWNGASARDLRRAMYTRDLPALCAHCAHARDPLPDPIHDVCKDAPPLHPSAAGASLATKSGFGVIRSDASPTLLLDGAPLDLTHFTIVAGTRHDAWTEDLEDSWSDGDRWHLPVPKARWESLAPYQGTWFTLVASLPDGSRTAVLPAAWCLVRSPAMPRIPGSQLHYADHEDDHDVAGVVHLGFDIPVRRGNQGVE